MNKPDPCPKIIRCEQRPPTLRGEHGLRLALRKGDAEVLKVYRLDGCPEIQRWGRGKVCDGVVVGKLSHGDAWVVFVELTSGEGKTVQQLEETARRMCSGHSEHGESPCHPWGHRGLRKHQVVGVVVGGSRTRIPKHPVKIRGKLMWFAHVRTRKHPWTLREFLREIGGGNV